MHWVYRVPFVAADLSPVLLGLTLALCRTRPSTRLSTRNLALLRVAMPAAAVVLAGFDSGQLNWTGHLPGGRSFQLNPLLITAAAAYLACVYLLLRRLARYCIAVGGAVLALILFGPTFAEIDHTLTASWSWSRDEVLNLAPKTPLQWGIAAITASFAMLGIGAAVSLSQREPSAKNEPDVPANTPS
jgi:hypothetical protein